MNGLWSYFVDLLIDLAETAVSAKDIQNFFKMFSDVEKGPREALTKALAKDGINTPAVVFRGGSKLLYFSINFYYLQSFLLSKCG